VRTGLVRFIRHLILHPGTLIAGLLGIVVVVALIVAIPIVAPSIPGLSSLRGPLAPPATEDYLRGNREYNADLVWNSLNSDAQSRLTSSGGSKDDLQQEMDTAKQKGVQVIESSYIGGKTLPDGTSMQFYLVGIRTQAGSNTDYQPYMFTVDRDGKIAKVQ
jgi:hypothetical protein